MKRGTIISVGRERGQQIKNGSSLFSGECVWQMASSSRGEVLMVTVGFIPRAKGRGGSRRVATLDSLQRRVFQAALRDANCFRLLPRGLKSTATFSASLRDTIDLSPPNQRRTHPLGEIPV